MPCERDREKTFSKNFPEKSENVAFGNLDQIERQGSRSERKVLQMQKESIEKTAGLDGTDEELIDVLIAISVVAKRLARKLQNEQKGECQHEQNE